MPGFAKLFVGDTVIHLAGGPKLKVAMVVNDRVKVEWMQDGERVYEWYHRSILELLSSNVN